MTSPIPAIIGTEPVSPKITTLAAKLSTMLPELIVLTDATDAWRTAIASPPRATALAKPARKTAPA